MPAKLSHSRASAQPLWSTLCRTGGLKFKGEKKMKKKKRKREDAEAGPALQTRHGKEDEI